MAFFSKSFIFLAIWLLFSNENATANRVRRLIDPDAKTDVEFKHITHQVMLFATHNLHQPFCGGTVIGNRFVLTAAHCVIDNDTNDFVGPVTIGANSNTLRQSDDEFRIYRDVVEIVVHGYYVKSTDGYDIAVLVLNRGLFEPHTKVTGLYLADHDETYDNVLAEVSGIGIDDPSFPTQGIPRDTEKYHHSVDLRYQEVKVHPSTECRRHWRRGFRDDQICGTLYSPHSRRGTCRGDSGSGLTYDGKVIGIASYNSNCNEGVNGWPSVYTRVSSYRDWILDVMEGYRDPNFMRYRRYYAGY